MTRWLVVAPAALAYGAAACAQSPWHRAITINGTDAQPVRMGKLRTEGVLTDTVRAAWHASYNGSTGYVDAPGYAYRETGVRLIYRF